MQQLKGVVLECITGSRSKLFIKKIDEISVKEATNHK
jgi:hypothetical protein